MKYFSKLKIDKTKLFYLVILAATFTIFLFLAFLNVEAKKEITELNVLRSPLSSFTPGKYPEVLSKYDPGITAQGAVAIDKNSQVVLYEKNSNLKFPPASTTKIMTALVALENYSPEDSLIIKQATVEGSIIGFKEGEVFSFIDLLYAMLLPSANDATLSIAQNYPGGEKAFVLRMNQKAVELHLKNTYYADPIGLDDEKDYITPLDLARLASIALSNPTFASVVSAKDKKIKSLNGKSYNLSNLNKLLDIPGVNGVKTGFTEGAGGVLVTSRKLDNGQDLIFVVMQSQDRFADSEILLSYLNDNLNYVSSHP